MRNQQRNDTRNDFKARGIFWCFLVVLLINARFLFELDVNVSLLQWGVLQPLLLQALVFPNIYYMFVYPRYNPLPPGTHYRTRAILLQSLAFSTIEAFWMFLALVTLQGAKLIYGIASHAQ